MKVDTLPIKEYLNRIKIMQKKIQDNDLDALIIVSTESEPANVRYFTNYVPIFETTGIFIPKEGDAILLIGPETETLAKDHSIIKKIRKLLEFRESSDPEYPDIQHKSFSNISNEVKGIKKLGLIGSNIMSLQIYEGITTAFKGIKIFKSDKLLREMRMIKSANELNLLRQAAVIASKGFDYALSKIKPGMSEIEATAECMYGVLSEGAESPGFKIWCVSGKGTTQAIGRSRHKKIRKNEVVQLAMGACVGGYVSSFGRPFVFGKIEPEVKMLFEIGLEANELTHKLIKSGTKASYIANKVKELIQENKIGDYIVYGPAHGIGLAECEYPFIESTSNYDLQENMTFAVDTFLASPSHGIRFEDTIAVTRDGEDQFAPYRREVLIL